MSTETSSTPQPHRLSPASRSLLITVVVVLTLLVVVAIYWFVFEASEERTEDAYVDGNIVLITPQTNGTVTQIHADNTDMIRAGDALIALNPVDARLALQRAEAQLAKTVRQVRGQYASATQMKAIIAQRKVDLSRARADMRRRSDLVKTGAVSSEEYAHTEETVQSAEAALQIAEQQFSGNQALVEGTTVMTHPDVVMAAMQVRDAYIGATRTIMHAPVGGMVTKRNVQVGQRVSPGTALMSVVALDHLWISANFKESQLKHLRIAQPVTVTADVYGRSVKYSGKIVGLDAGTGSAFSLMPAQNATGNWIKVVQRVPVRIALDPEPLAAHPLRLGLSVNVKVNTGSREGSALATLSSTDGQGNATKVFDEEQSGADALISHIIAVNSNTAPINRRIAQR